MKVIANANQKEGVAKTTTTHWHVVTSIIDLAPLEMDMISRASREKILERALKLVGS